MIIKSNTAGKLNKIIDGTVFSNEYMFIKEFLQNAQRAKATHVSIDVNDFSIVFRDNGKGCKKASNIFTLDLSEWDTTNEGFGIGFWSCLALKDLIKVKVRSFNWSAEILVDDILNGNLEVDLTNDLDAFEGFEVTLTTNLLDESKKKKIENEVKNVAQYLDFETIYNNTYIEKIDIFATVDGEFSQMINTRDFQAKISISDINYSTVKLFYDKREVCNLYNMGYISGIIEPKKGKINLKEPDRTSFIYDDKYNDLKNKLKKEIKKLYIEFLKSNPGEVYINKYSDAINYHLDVKDYEKYMDFESIVSDFDSAFGDRVNSNSNINKEKTDTSFTKDLSLYNKDFLQEDYICPDNKSLLTDEISVITTQKSFFIKDSSTNPSESIFTECALSFSDSKEEISVVDDSLYEDRKIEDIKEDFTMPDYVVYNHDRQSHISNIDNFISKRDKESKSKEFKNYMKNKNKIAWVLKEDVDTYSEEIAQAEYAKIKVIKVENILYANIFKKHKKMHISEFKDCFKETFTFKNIQLKNYKEERVIQNLIPICKKYNLPLNTFVIGNIEVNSKLEYNGKILFSERSKNTKDSIKVYAVEDNGLIILDRTALNLSRFKLSKEGPFGINDLKCIFSIINTIAHELAHLLYGTNDNTINHYKTETVIQKEIIELYI